MVPTITHSFVVIGPICSSFFVAKAGASGVSFTSGGNSLYRIYGVARSETIAGKLAALNHDTHGLEILTPSSSASFRHNRFCAAAVRKSALELQAACHAPKKNSDGS